MELRSLRIFPWKSFLAPLWIILFIIFCSFIVYSFVMKSVFLTDISKEIESGMYILKTSGGEAKYVICFHEFVMPSIGIIPCQFTTYHLGILQERPLEGRVYVTKQLKFLSPSSRDL